MSIPAAFASIALGFAKVTGAGFHEAIAKWPGTPVLEGGSIVSPGVPVEHDCHVQIDAATEAMRAADGFKDTDMRLLVLADTIDRPLDTGARVAVLAGPYAGSIWSLQSCSRDPAAAYFECRGRRA